MAPTGSSCSLFGMVRHHVIALAAILISTLLLTSAQTAPNADSLNLQTAKEAHKDPSSSYPHNHHPPSPLSSDGDQQLRMNHPDFEKEEEEEEHAHPSTSGGGSSEAEAEMEGGEPVPGKRLAPAAPGAFQWKRMYGPGPSTRGMSGGDAWSKRFIQGFVGSRGKRKEEEEEEGKRFAPRFSAGGPWQGAAPYGDGKIPAEALSKRMFHQHAFVGSRGKRSVDGEEDEEEEMMMVPVAKRFLPFLFGPQQQQQQQPQRIERRWFNPSGFTASRGKRYMPGLEALMLSQMYKKLDAEKWKRQSMLGFHAARG